MRTFVAVGKGVSSQGQLLSCLVWAQKQISDEGQDLVRVFRFRMGERAGRLVAEIMDEGTRWIKGYTIVPVGLKNFHV